METGTGKTLVYIRTIYELYKHHGLTKFIIIVPSVAIREVLLERLSGNKPGRVLRTVERYIAGRRLERLD